MLTGADMVDPSMRKCGFKRCVSCPAVFLASNVYVQGLKCLGGDHFPAHCAIYCIFITWAQKERQNRLQTLLLVETLSIKYLGFNNYEGSEKKHRRLESALSTSGSKKVSVMKALVSALSSVSKSTELPVAKSPDRLQNYYYPHWTYSICDSISQAQC